MDVIKDTINAANTKHHKEIKYKLQPVCPRCNTASRGEIVSAFYSISTRYNNKAYLLYFCPVCDTCYMVVYSLNRTSSAADTITDIFPLPKSSVADKFPSGIEAISSTFIDIYYQALEAEKLKLNHLSGIGYRKAVEFLIKDYCCYKDFDSIDIIKSKPLGQCIRDYIENEKIKTLALAATWIGNDETHYVRKHEDYDIEHLKVFIKSMVAYIEYETAYEEALAFTLSK